MLVYIKKHETVTLEQITAHFKSPVAAERFEMLKSIKFVIQSEYIPDGLGGSLDCDTFKLSKNGLKYLEDYRENSLQGLKNGLLKWFADLLKP